jgi:hypothetical protein
MAQPNGTADRIRKILQRRLDEGRSAITAAEIGEELTLETRRISNALTGMLGVFRHRKSNRNLTMYSLKPFPGGEVKQKKSSTPKHYHDWRTPEITPQSYDIYAARNLAMLAR